MRIPEWLTRILYPHRNVEWRPGFPNSWRSTESHPPKVQLVLLWQEGYGVWVARWGEQGWEQWAWGAKRFRPVLDRSRMAWAKAPNPNHPGARRRIFQLLMQLPDDAIECSRWELQSDYLMLDMRHIQTKE